MAFEEEQGICPGKYGSVYTNGIHLSTDRMYAHCLARYGVLRAE